MTEGASIFLTQQTLGIFVLGAIAFMIATFGGILIVKLINLFLKEESKINPLIGNAGVAALPDSARVTQVIGLEYDKTIFLLVHAMGPNIAGLIGSALAAGVMLTFLY